MQRLQVSGAVRPLYGSLGVKGLIINGSSKWRKVNCFKPAFCCVLTLRIAVGMYRCFGGTYFFHLRAKYRTRSLGNPGLTYQTTKSGNPIRTNTNLLWLADVWNFDTILA